MVAGGLPEPCCDHARHICLLAIQMMEVFGEMRFDGEIIQVR